MLKIHSLLFILCAILTLTAAQTSAQTDKDTQPATTSTLNNVRLPAGALRVNDGSVPAEITDTLGKLIALGQGKLRQGESEVLVWTGGNYRKSNAAQIVKLFTGNLQRGGWTYVVGEQTSEFTVFNSINTGDRRAVIGFWTANDESLLLAWTEMLPANASNAVSSNGNQTANNTSRTPIAENAENVLRVGAETDYVNVMVERMPGIPEFSALPKKPGYIRGYVKDSLGQPLAGAKLGLKSARIYNAYLANSAETDAKGYYEIKIPTGGARFDYAGFTIAYGSGRAALGLHPVDGSLSESYPETTGAVENFVLLQYGIADAEDVKNNPRYRANYYGGTFLIRYFIGGFDGMFKPGEEIFIALKPVSLLSDGGKFARAFVIRKTVEDSSLGEFYICNVPVGRYELFVTDASGKPLKMWQKAPTDSVFGIQPTETTGSAQLIFNPLSADAKTAIASRGNWTDLEIIVERP